MYDIFTHDASDRSNKRYFTTFCTKRGIIARPTAREATTNCIVTNGENEDDSEWASRDSHFLSFNRIQQERAGHKTKQDAPRKGRNLTSGGLLPYSLPHANASSRSSPSSATCSCIKAVSIAGYITSFHWSLYSRHNPTGFVSTIFLVFWIEEVKD
jgi:hypothetical protein